MNLFLALSCLFFIGCVGGWLLELIFRRLVHKKWINPGFLTGPYLPLYGVGVVFLYLICSCDYSFINNTVWRHVFVILLITVIMTMTEFITGLIFTRFFHVKLWDYSDRKGNLDGIICPLFTFFWGVIGAVYYFAIHNRILAFLDWFSSNLAFSFVVGMFFGIFILDVISSFNIVTKIKRFAEKNDLIIKYETFKLTVAEKAARLKQKAHFLRFLHGKNMDDELDNYKGLIGQTSNKEEK